MSKRELTASDNYFEDFEVGKVYKHARGKTITENEAVTLCHLVMNSADAHFNDDKMKDTVVGESVVYGGVTISITIGLAYQDTGEQVIEERGLTGIKLMHPVIHGNTLYAYTEVLAKEDLDDHSGLVTFRHYGVDQDENVAFQGDRTAQIFKRPH